MMAQVAPTSRIIAGDISPVKAPLALSRTFWDATSNSLRISPRTNSMYGAGTPMTTSTSGLTSAAFQLWRGRGERGQTASVSITQIQPAGDGARWEVHHTCGEKGQTASVSITDTAGGIGARGKCTLGRSC